MTREWTFREIVALCLLALFAWAFYMNPTNGSMQGAVLTAFATAYGFYLGGSKVGSDTATKNADTVADQAKANSGDPAPKDAAEGAQRVADAAAKKADQIEGAAT